MIKDKQLVIVGAGGHGSVIADIARLNGYRSILFLDDACAERADGYSVAGKVEDSPRFMADSDFILAIGNNATRERLQTWLSDQGANLATLIHPHAVIGENVTLGKGTAIMAGAVVNPGAAVGDGVILNTCSSVDHDCRVGNFVHIAVGAHLCGTVTVGDGAFICAGATVINNISVCKGATVGAGAVVVKDITEKGTYVGVPARRIV
ncbi:MAG: acetyltransferase [Clostridia bacterium]|nr:acetyltransferase [Clostridia bacterium]